MGEVNFPLRDFDIVTSRLGFDVRVVRSPLREAGSPITGPEAHRGTWI